MKRVLFIIWMLALVIHLQQAAHAENTALFSDDFAGSIQSIVNSDEGIVVLGQKGLFLWRPDTNLQEQILHREKLPSSGDLSLVLWQGKPFLLDQWTGQLYQVVDGQAYLAYAIPEDVLQYEDQGEMTTKQIVRCVTAGDRLFLLLGSFTFEQGDVKELYALESDLQTLTRLSSQEIQALWSAAGEQLLVEEILDGANRLCLYDPQTQNNLRVWNELDTQEKAGFVWDEEEKTLYYTGDSGKVYALAEDGSIILCAYLPFKFQYTSDSAFLYHQQTYAYLHSGMFFMRELQRDGASVITLNIMGMPDEQMIARFSAEYPEISINLQNRTEDIQALQRAIILSDGSVDLYLVASDGIYSDVIEKGYAMTLEASEALRGYAERFYPWVRDVIIKDDQLLALPASVSIDHWTMNQTKWNELALGDRPKTLEQLFQLADRWQADYAQDNEDWCLFDCLDGLGRYAGYGSPISA